MNLMTLTFHFRFRKEPSVYRILNYNAVLYQLACLICLPTLVPSPFPSCSVLLFFQRTSLTKSSGGRQQTANKSPFTNIFFNEFLQLGLKLAGLSGEMQIAEGPENSQVMKA